MPSPPEPLYAFGPFEVDAAARTLRREGALLPVPPKAFDLFLALLEARGAVVEKDALMQRVWPDTFVEEGNLPVNVFALRKALGDQGDTLIRTVPRRGYAFAAPIAVRARGEEREAVAAAPPAAAASAAAPPVIAPPVIDPSVAASPHGASPAAAPSRHGVVVRPASRRWMWVSAAALVVVAAGWGLMRPRTTLLQSVQSMAVLPFDVQGAEADSGYVGAGFAASVTSRLVGLNDVIVRPFASTAKYSEPQQNIVEAGKALQVDVVLRGSMRALGDQINVAASLVRVEDGAQVWTFTATEPATRLASLEGDLVQRIARALSSELPQDAAVEGSRAPEPAAYDAFLRGRSVVAAQTPRAYARAAEYFGRAIEHDGDFAEAHAALAAALMFAPATATSREALARARAEAERAIALAPSQVEAHAALSRVLLLDAWDWARAEQALRAAIGAAPYDAEPHFWYAQLLSAQGRHDEALSEIRLAQDIDPTSPRINLYVGTLLLAARRYEESGAQLRKTPIDMGAVNQQVFLGTAVSLAKRQQWPEAFATMARLTRTAGSAPAPSAYLAYLSAEAGRLADADQALLAAEAQLDAERTPHVVLAAAYGCRGRSTEAFRELDRAYEMRDPRIIYMNVDPMLDCVRADPRFGAAVTRIGLSARVTGSTAAPATSAGNASPR